MPKTTSHLLELLQYEAFYWHQSTAGHKNQNS